MVTNIHFKIDMTERFNLSPKEWASISKFDESKNKMTRK